jgi:response regulator RpfG family c-di-GMP phosphodiesterase
MAPLRILIIDDSSSTRKGLKELLSPLKAEITEAANGYDGLSIALDAHIDLVITDIDMPQMNGIELCQALKHHPDTRGIPVIMVSAFDSDHDIDLGFQAGAAAYLSKRDARTYLFDTIEKVLSKSTFQRKQLIMVVEDSRPVSRLVEEGLAQSGFQVITAKHGKEALEFLTSKRPDLILSDLDMPEMNGFQLCEALHADQKLCSIPFVVMSTMSGRGQMKRIIQQGAAGYIVKPFNIDELVILLERLLSDQFQILLKERERLDTERNVILASIASLVSALEARDAYTRGHSESVSEILTNMAVMMGASKQEQETASLGGKLHDIGKIGIRDDILLKPGPLTDQEYDIIKQHPVIGSNILKPIPSLSEIIPIVFLHHERIDGKGYPLGLKGRQIPLWPRMAAVADTYSALTSKRPYKKVVPPEKALEIIQEVKGTQLCPECVEVFMQWIESSEGDSDPRPDE